jgi:hypothetical protein
METEFNLNEWKSMLSHFGYNTEKLANRRGISLSARYRRIKNPSIFSYSEIMELFKIFGKKRVMAAFFGGQSQNVRLGNEAKH